MTLLYIVTFGSFIGFSNALPLSINVDLRPEPCPGPDRRAEAHAEPERAVGTDLRVDRPLRRRADPSGGRWISDKVGGSIVTQVISVVMVAASARWAT